ncbi:acyltransferase family protein [Alteriqipengyuania sp.]|uniref:acyltransferase family protein n=1 Tax=Alteriqipengyuania sp. TaxID=2800692 RepID=UPI0035198779
MDSMRGVSACIIVLLHVFGAGWITGSTFIARGNLFVDFFFVLSGFVIAASYGERLAQGFPMRSFAFLRLGRLYPLHLAMLVVFAGLVGLREAGVFPADAIAWQMGSHEPGQFVRALLMVENFAPGTSGWNGPSWSIEVELWTYLIAALAFAWLGRSAAIVFAFIAAGAGGAMLLYYMGIKPMPLGLNPYNLLRCLFAFSLGVIAWEGHRRFTGAWLLPRGLTTVLELGLVLLCVLAITFAPTIPLRTGIPFLFTALLLVLAHERGWVSHLLMRRFPVLLGTLSYSIYMTHAAVLLTIAMLAANLGWFDPTIGPVPGSRGTVLERIVADLVAFGMLGVVILVSWCTYRWIERPAREWSRKIVARRDAARAEAIAPTF